MKRYVFGCLLILGSVTAACGGSGSGDGESADEDAGLGSSPVDAGHKDAAVSLPVAHADGGTNLSDAATAPAVDAGGGASGTTSLTGSLGAGGAIQPIVSSLVISNSGETLVYLTTAALTCEQLTVSRWLGAFTTGAQVVEIVVSGAAKVGAAKSPEVNWATGGKSSSYEQNAKTASVTFTKSEAMGVVEGTVTATYSNPSGTVSGNFHAEFCPHGQGY